MKAKILNINPLHHSVEFKIDITENYVYYDKILYELIKTEIQKEKNLKVELLILDYDSIRIKIRLDDVSYDYDTEVEYIIDKFKEGIKNAWNEYEGIVAIKEDLGKKYKDKTIII